MAESDSKKTVRFRFTTRIAVIVILGVLLGACITCLFYQMMQNRRLHNVYPEIAVEVGSGPLTAQQFLREPDDSVPFFVTDVSKISLYTPSTTRVEFSWHNKVYESILRIQDTVAPVGQVQDLTVLDIVPDPREFVTQSSDMTPVTVSYKNHPDPNCRDTQDVIIVLSDSSGNTTELTAKLTLAHDSTPPVIEGVPEMFAAYEGEPVFYKQGVTVTDDYDKHIKLQVDTHLVDLSKPGRYPIEYSATDLSGNTTSVDSKVIVYKRTPEYAEKDVIWKEIDSIIEEIIEDNMTTEQQVRAIYDYTRNHFNYGEYPDKVDYLQAAHFMIVRGFGDCYNHFGIAKAMYERLDIPNIDVEKIKNYPSDSKHFWSLVSLDGGKTYYHVDPTPRRSGGDFCLVTDEVLDKYSESHGGSHNRDHSLYPATPEE